MLCNQYDVPAMQVELHGLAPPPHPPPHTHTANLKATSLSLSHTHTANLKATSFAMVIVSLSVCPGGQLVSIGGLGAFCGYMLKFFCVYSYS